MNTRGQGKHNTNSMNQIQNKRHENKNMKQNPKPYNKKIYFIGFSGGFYFRTSSTKWNSSSSFSLKKIKKITFTSFKIHIGELAFWIGVQIHIMTEQSIKRIVVS